MRGTLRRMSELQESDIQLVRVGYPTQMRRISDFWKTDIRLVEDGWPTSLPWITELIVHKESIMKPYREIEFTTTRIKGDLAVGKTCYQGHLQHNAALW